MAFTGEANTHPPVMCALSVKLTGYSHAANISLHRSCGLIVRLRAVLRRINAVQTNGYAFDDNGIRIPYLRHFPVTTSAA